MQDSVKLEVKVKKTFRNEKVAGMFDVPFTGTIKKEIFHDPLPELTDDFNIGCIVGPSGSGKSTSTLNKYGYFSSCSWDKRSIVDCFHKDMDVKSICNALSFVGLASPPTWMQPYATLSTGQKFRADMARCLTENDVSIVDEYTSTVDREVAKFGSAAISKYVKKNNKKLIVVSCHYDILEWLQPDWVLDMASGKLARGSLQRDPIRISIGRCDISAWQKFKGNHYLSADINKAAAKHCWGLWANGTLVSFYALLHFPHARVRNIKKSHRIVTLPDYQGFGFGVLLTDTVAHYYAMQGFRVRESTSHPALIASRAKSKLWKMVKQPAMGKSNSTSSKVKGVAVIQSFGRTTASFEYIGHKAGKNNANAN